MAAKIKTTLAVKHDTWLYLMLIPGLLFFIIYRYGPMFGIIIAFQDFSPWKGFLGSPFVGLKHFRRILEDPMFLKLLGNTLFLSVLNIVFYFPYPIILSLLLNEIRHRGYKRTIQTVIYLPHFLSWVILYGLTVVILRYMGVVNEILARFGAERINFLLEPFWFRIIYVVQNLWKEGGWGTIIFLAAMTNVNPEVYDSAVVDGAGRFRRMWHVTIPSIRSVIVILLILRLGGILSVGFEQILLLINSMNRSAAEVLATYIFRIGIQGSQYSFSAAIGLFNSLIGLILIWAANFTAKKIGEQGLF